MMAPAPRKAVAAAARVGNDEVRIFRIVFAID